MTSKHSAKLNKSISKAASKFSSKSSDLHKSLASELKKLGKQHDSLIAAFERRQTKRTSTAQTTLDARLAAAEADLERAKVEQAPLLANGNPHLEQLARSIIEFEKGKIELTKTLGRSDFQQARREDDIDQSLLLWIEELSLHSIDAIQSDKARKRAIAIINAGLIVGGLVTAPIVPGLSALIAAIFVAKQWADAELEVDSNSDAHRIQRATKLLKHVNSIMEAWLKIL